MAWNGQNLVIVGDGESAEIAYEYFSFDSPHTVVGFAVERDYLKKTSLYGLPVVALEEAARVFPPADHAAHVAISSTFLNRLRAHLFLKTKSLGYRCVSYVSSRAFVWRNVEVGENSFIFENNVLQHHVRVGSNCVLWSGNHVGHRTVIRDHVFVSSHVVISGFCEVGEYTFMGVNSTVGDNVKIANDVVVGAGAVVVKDAEARRVYVGSPAKPLDKDSFDSFKVPASMRG